MERITPRASPRKAGAPRFGAIPERAFRDRRLTLGDLCVLGVVAVHDGFGKNGYGCTAGRKAMAQECGFQETSVSHALSNLRLYGYITAEAHPLDGRLRAYRVIYDPKVSAPIEHQSDRATQDDQCSKIDDRCSETPRSVLGQNDNPLKSAANSSLNILENIQNTEGREHLKGNGKYPAEAGWAMKKREEDDPAWATNYLDGVESLLGDPLTRIAARHECAVLSRIVDSESLPVEIRERAAGLRTGASNAA